MKSKVDIVLLTFLPGFFMLIGASALIGVTEVRFGYFGKHVNSEWTQHNCTIEQSRIDLGLKNSHRAVFDVSFFLERT